MILIKALLAGLAGVSLCMADISGIVTDTGTTPISGAVVQLENGGQPVTTVHLVLPAVTSLFYVQE